eukprot:3927941-Amphidinium_carterae.1
MITVAAVCSARCTFHEFSQIDRQCPVHTEANNFFKRSAPVGVRKVLVATIHPTPQVSNDSSVKSDHREL